MKDDQKEKAQSEEGRSWRGENVVFVDILKHL